MRRWLAILLLLFAAAVVQADAIVVSKHHCMRTSCAVLTSGDELPVADSGIPLFAVAATAPVSQLYGGELPVSKGKHSISELMPQLRLMRILNPNSVSVSQGRLCAVFIVGWRSVDRYVFALRKIII